MNLRRAEAMKRAKKGKDPTDEGKKQSWKNMSGEEYMRKTIQGFG